MVRVTFHAFRVAREQRATCPACKAKNQVAIIINFFGQCEVCTARLQSAARKATMVLSDVNLSLQFRITLAASILTAAATPGRRVPVALPVTTSRRMAGAR